MAHILDIDLDFFLSDVRHFEISKGQRLPSREYVPWSAGDVETFLSERCRLRRDRPSPGCFVDHHQQVHEHLRRLAMAEPTQAPFDMVHVDAHADLGMGTSGAIYVMQTLVHEETEQRRKHDVKREICEGSWLLFSLAERMLASLVYVHHPDEEPSDVPWWLRLNEETCLKVPVLTQSECDRWRKEGKLDPSRFDPPVPLSVCHPDFFVADSTFDYVFVTRSPEYTPVESDQLLPVIGEYVAAGDQE